MSQQININESISVNGKTDFPISFNIYTYQHFLPIFSCIPFGFLLLRISSSLLFPLSISSNSGRVITVVLSVRNIGKRLIRVASLQQHRRPSWFKPFSHASRKMFNYKLSISIYGPSTRMIFNYPVLQISLPIVSPVLIDECE